MTTRQGSGSRVATAAVLDASPADIFRALTTASEHSAFTGAPSRIDARVDGTFSYFDGAVTDVFRRVDEPTLIEQVLRAEAWPGTTRR